MKNEIMGLTKLPCHAHRATLCSNARSRYLSTTAPWHEHVKSHFGEQPPRRTLVALSFSSHFKMTEATVPHSFTHQNYLQKT